MSDRYVKKGISMTPGQWQRLNDIADDWEDREVGSVSAAQVAREALAFGLVVLETTDDVPEFRRLHMRDRRAMVRQAMLDKLQRDGLDS